MTRKFKLGRAFIEMDTSYIGAPSVYLEFELETLLLHGAKTLNYKVERLETLPEITNFDAGFKITAKEIKHDSNGGGQS